MTVALLRHMATRPDFAVYERALPILGVDGTIAERCGGGQPGPRKSPSQERHALLGELA